MKSYIFLKECECGMYMICIISLQCVTIHFYFVICGHFLCHFLSVNVWAQYAKPTMDLSSIIIVTSTFVFLTFLHDIVHMDQRPWWDRRPRELTCWQWPFPSLGSLML
jgi:hypothetical protein